MKIYKALIILAVILTAGCATDPGVPDVSGESAAEVPETEIPVKEPVKKVSTVFYPVLEESFFGDGVKDEYKVYTYDNESGMVVKKELFSADDELQETDVYDYSDSERGITSSFNSEDQLLSKTVELEDESGNIVRKENYDGKDNLMTASEYRYSGNLKTGWTVFSGSGAVLSVTDYVYENDELVRINILNPGGDIEEYFLINYNEEGNVSGQVHYSADEAVIDSRSFEYENGFPVMEVIHRKNGSVERKIMYVNDEWGNPLETVFMDAGNNVSERIVIKYESREVISYE